VTIVTRALISTFISAVSIGGVSAARTPPAQHTSAVASSTGKAAEPADASANAAGPARDPQEFTYNREGRRDPFVSLLRRGSNDAAIKGPRPSGLAGMGTTEVSLRGTLMSPSGGYVGILQGIDNKSYVVHVGDKLLDGSIRAISADAVVIVQQVDNPLSLEKAREVRKLLRPTEAAK
jgi:hypothetical protein